MVCDIIEHSWAASGRTQGSQTIGMSHEILEASNIMRDFLFRRVYDLRSAQEESEKARGVIRLLYKYFGKHEQELPPEYCLHGDKTERKVVDYIAGMTDRYALRVAQELTPGEKIKGMSIEDERY
jgi:dGTPase